MTESHNRSVVIIGAGINGLVAANYLQRAGYQVTLLERKTYIGGACVSQSFFYKGKEIRYPQGASVLGMMQDFVFRETGLYKKIEIFAPDHEEIIWFKDEKIPTKIERNEKFDRDLQKVVTFLREGYRSGNPPTLEEAEKKLGADTVSLWITGTARNLIDTYFTSERTKIFYAISVNESGPVSIDNPYSAFTIPLMLSGSVFEGAWGFVKGGIWKITEALGDINADLGVKIITGATVEEVSPDKKTVSYTVSGNLNTIKADKIIFATDPLSAAKIVRDEKLIKKIENANLLGTSGKLILAFKKPVRWKDTSDETDFASAFRFIILKDTLKSFEESSLAPKNGADFSPGYLEIYPEGPAMEHMGTKDEFHLITVFFKDLGLNKKGIEVSDIKKQVAALVLSKIENADDVIESILLTPKDMQEIFYFPMGNIDHVELSEGQTFFARNYSPDPENNFYQFGDNKNVFYCAAGSYPCGSVAGTPGYMCAKQIIDKSNR